MAKKLRFDESFGLDLNQVIGWKRVPPQRSDYLLPLDDWNLEVYTHANKITFIKGEAGFDYVLKKLCEECGFELPKDTL
jgi:hypothetical protein